MSNADCSPGCEPLSVAASCSKNFLVNKEINFLQNVYFGFWYFNKCSAVAEMGDRLATIDKGQKLESCTPFGRGSCLGPHVTQCGLCRGLSSYQVASWSIQPFGHNKHGPKIGGVPFLGERELGPHLAKCGLGLGLPLYQVASWSMQPFGHKDMGWKFWWALPLIEEEEQGHS